MRLLKEWWGFFWFYLFGGQLFCFPLLLLLLLGCLGQFFVISCLEDLFSMLLESQTKPFWGTLVSKGFFLFF